MLNNHNSPETPANFIKNTALIHLALIMGQVLFGIVAFAQTKSIGLNLKPDGDLVFYIVPLLIVSGMLSGRFLFKQQISKLADKNLLKEKLSGYLTAFILRCALAEAPSLFAIVVYLLTGNVFYLILVGFNMLYFIGIRPTKDKLKDELNLTYEDEIAMGPNI